MRVSQLPFVPRAQPDELLSSWLERIGLLYGASIEHVLGAVLAGSDRMPTIAGQDIDADPWMRKRIVRWSGVNDGEVSESGLEAFLGAGLHLEWMDAAWISLKHVAYRGDMDAWGVDAAGQGSRPAASSGRADDESGVVRDLPLDGGR